jgi:hypothetical protein
MTDREALAAHVEAAFPIEALHSIEQVLRHGNDCPDCSLMATELEHWRRVAIDRAGLAMLAGMQQHLTASGWRWFVSRFLREAIANENASNRLEIESLVYFLSPAGEIAGAADEVIETLSVDQLDVLFDFHLWLASNDFWQDYAGRDINAAMVFLKEAIDSR